MPVDLRFPFTGHWLTQHSPADRVPSHGTTLFATTFDQQHKNEQVFHTWCKQHQGKC